MRKGILVLMILVVAHLVWGEVIFYESMGSVSSTTSILSHETNNGFDNDDLTMTDGGVSNPADIRSTSSSSGYNGASGNANIWFTSTVGERGFAIEDIDASNFYNIQLQFGYRKESASSLPTLNVDYWNGTIWVNLEYPFNELEAASTGWYLSPTIDLPEGANIDSLKIRWVKSGVIAVRIDDVKLTGTSLNPYIELSPLTLSGFSYGIGHGPSEEQTFTVQGSYLTTDISIEAPTNYEISKTSGSGYTSPLTFTNSGGSVPVTSVYVRLKEGLTIGDYNGEIITASSSGAYNKTVTCNGKVTEIQPKVIITEVADNSSFAREYIELYNADNESINIDGWIIIERFNANNTDERSLTMNSSSQINTGGENYLILEPGEFAVILRDSNELNGFKSDYSISDNIAIFSGSVPQMNGNERYKLVNSYGDAIDYFGDWDRSPVFELASGFCYERINGEDSDGQLEENWKKTANSSYTYTPGSSNDAPLPVTLSSFTAGIDAGLPVLWWTTESEQENMGWNLYRSNEENGINANNFLQLNETLIPGMGTTTQPTSYFFVDEHNIAAPGAYWYWLQSVSFSGELEMFGPVSLQIGEGGIPDLPQYSSLQANYPNPFNPVTTIEFSIREGDNGTLTIYNIAGQKILVKDFPAGNHLFHWNADDQASGVYFYQLRAPSFYQSRKMILIK